MTLRICFRTMRRDQLVILASNSSIRSRSTYVAKAVEALVACLPGLAPRDPMQFLWPENPDAKTTPAQKEKKEGERRSKRAESNKGK